MSQLMSLANKLEQNNKSSFSLTEQTPKKFVNSFKKEEDNALRSTIPKTQHVDNQPLVKIQEEEKLQTQKIQKKKIKKLWSKQEDDLLRSLVQTKGAKQWGFISNHFENRCGKQCRQRWHNHLRNGIKKGNWTSYEQWILFLGVYAYGKKWSVISKFLKGRTQNTLKNHWNCKMKPKKNKLFISLKKILEKQTNQVNILTSLQEKLIKQIIKNNYQDHVTPNKYNDSNYLQYVQHFKRALFDFEELRSKIYKDINKIQKKRNKEYFSPHKRNFQFQNFETFGKKRLNFDINESHQLQNINQFLIKEEYLSNQNQDLQDLQISRSSYNYSQQNESFPKSRVEKSDQEKSENVMIQYYFQSPSKNNIFVKINLQESHQKN